VVPNVVDMAPAPENNHNSDKKKILHISLLKDDIKNVSGIIEATSILHRKRADFKLHIIGDGNDRDKLEDLARSQGLLDKVVFFHGMLDEEEITRQICSSDFSVINSNFETFSVSTAESLACGKPVVVTRCGGPEEFVDDKCGVLVERKDTKGLAGAIEYMLDNYQRYDPKAIAQYARSRFSSSVVGKEI
jgi:glycosyltransferase involved in cell wall biosynthesis